MATAVAVVGVSGAAVAAVPRVAAPRVAAFNAGSAKGPAGNPHDEARRTGARVEVTAARTEYNTTYADPSGTTTVEMSSTPVRVHRGSGWVEVDPTLVRRSDGMVAPKAAAVDVAFSGGGSGPLARVRHEGDLLDIGSPVSLPVPVLSGSTATYSGVLPGVDLVVSVSGDAFGEVLVVQDRAAAENPELRLLRFPLDGQGLAAARTADGGVEVRDPAGERVLLAQHPTMWDSTSGPAESAAGTAASALGPVEGNQVAPVQVSVASGELTVIPDATLLSASTTTFPLFIDPQLNAGKTQWAMVNKTFATTPYYNWGNGSNGLGEGMGYISTAADGTHTKRLFFAYNTGSLRTTGRTIVSSTFRTHEVWADTCTTVGVEAWLTNGFTSGTTWNTQPSWVGPATVRNVATSGRPDCSPSGTEIDFDTTNQVIKSVLNGWATTTIGLKASSETSSSGWRRFTNNSTLEVVYNTYPNLPSEVQMTSPPALCGSSVPYLDPPMMQVKVTDPDGTANQVRAHFRLYQSGASAPMNEYYSAYGASGSTFQQQLPTLPAGSYTWIAQAQDNQSPQLSSGWSGWCNFTVDATAPTPPDIWYDSGTFAVGQDLQFHFTGGGSDVTQYRWSVNGDAPSLGPVSVYDGKATIHLTTFGPFYLRVWAYDAAGNRGAPNVWGQGMLVSGGDARDWWRMDEGTGSTSANQKSPGNGLVTSGGVSWTQGYPIDTSSAMVFSGAGSFGAGLGQGGPADGDNFSACAWGKLDETQLSGGRHVLLSQDADANSAFTIAEDTFPDANGNPVPRFVATLHTPDGGTAVQAVSATALSPDVWAHACITVSTLESGAIELDLYTTVAGEASIQQDSAFSAAGTPAYATSAASTAYVRVGAEEMSYAMAGFWGGAVDEVVTAKGVFDELQRNQYRYPPAP